MQPKSTLTSLGSFCMRIFAIALILVLSTQFSFGQQPEAKVPTKAQVKMQTEQRAQLNAKLQRKQINALASADNDLGMANKAAGSSTHRTNAICQTFTGSLAAGDATMTTRLFRGGIVSTCAAPAPFPGTSAVTVFFDTYTYTNTSGLAQCATFTLTTNDLTNANIEHGIWSTFNPANLSAGYLADPGLSTGTPQTAPLVFSRNLAAGETVTIAVWSANAASGGPTGGASDYTVTVDLPICSSAPCSGTPNPGQTISSVPTVCPGISFTLSLTNNTPGSGVSYQWQQSTAGVGGPYTNSPPTSTGSTYTTTQSVQTWYRCQVTCGANTGISIPVVVNSTPASNCYCNAGATDVTFEKISNVVFNTINNPSSSTAGYENFLNISTTVVKGQQVPIVVSISNPFASDQVSAWIDFNQNGNFIDPGEQVYLSGQGGGPHSGTVTIATGATTGPTRLRIRMWDAGFEANPGPCGNSTFGQVEDYTVNIQPCIQGVWTQHPTSTAISCGGSATFTANASGSFISYRWQMQLPSSTSWNDIANGNDVLYGGTYSNATTAALTVSNTTVAMNGYKYRALMSGPCTGIDFSNTAVMTVNPLVATVNPPSANICIGSIQALTITNTASTPVTTTFSSGVLSIPVPDNNVAGISHTIPVSGITGSVTGVSIKFTIAGHTFPSDLVVAVRAPNGNTLNLDYHISGTGAAPGAGAPGMVNTIISSAGLNALSSSSNPYSATFKADAQMTTNAAFGTPPAATGFATNMVNSFNGLTSTPNGNWTIAIFDGFNLDFGTFTGWSVDITSVVPVPATGIWTSNPAAPNTMWTNPAANIPYVAGTPLTTIYVNPTVNTVYSVVVTTALCTTAPTLVPVNVFTPLSNLSAPANTSACAGSTATFSVTGNGGPLSYQWQVSADNGLTYTNVAGGTGATLTLTNVLQTMNNYKYRVNVASSPCNSATSSVATLTVNPLPVVTLTATDLNIVPGGTSTITATSVPAALNATSYTWTLNGATIAGATSNSVVADIDKLGTYVATVTDVNGCKNTSSILIGTEAKDRLWIYPNPSPDGKFQVRLYHRGDLSERRIVRVYTAQGDLVKRIEFNQYNTNSRYQRMDVDLSKYSPGSYLVTVENKYAENIASGIVVIQH